MIADYLEKRMKWCLTKDECKVLTKDHTKSDSSSFKVPAIDRFMKKLLGNTFPEEQHGELAKIQAATLLPICPLDLCGSHY